MASDMALPQQATATATTPIASAGSGNFDSLTCQWTQCGERCTSPETLYDHVCERHVGRKSTNNLNLQCQWGSCRTTTVKRDHITSHIRVHVPLKPHKCDLCGKSFKRPQDRKKHVKTHADESVLLRSPDAPLPTPQLQSNYQQMPKTLQSTPFYQTTAPLQSNGYGYSMSSGGNNHYGAQSTAPSYGPVYYNLPQTTGYAALGQTDSRKRGFEDLDNFFGAAKRRQIDATQYQDLGSRFGGFMNSMPIGQSFGGYQNDFGVGGMMGDAGTAMAYQSQQSMPSMHSNYMPFNELKTKDDLISIDRFLEQLQNTVYEQPGQVSTSLGMDAMAHPVPTTTSHYGSISLSTSSVTDETPALTPSSIHASQSPASVQNNVSPISRPASGLYPTLPSLSNLTDSQPALGYGASASSLGPTDYDYGARRRFSGGYLNRAAAPLRSSELPSISASRRASIDRDALLTKGIKAVVLSPEQSESENKRFKLPGVASLVTGAAANDDMDIDSNNGAGSPTARSDSSADERQESWVQNMRVIEALRHYVRGRMEREDFGDQTIDDNKDNEGREEAARVDGETIPTRARLPERTSGASLYPILRAVEATS